MAYEAIVEGKVPKQSNDTTKSTVVVDPFEKYKDVYQPPKDPVEYKEWLEVAKQRAREVSEKQYRHLQGYIKFLDNIRRTLRYPSILTGILAIIFIIDNAMNLVAEQTFVKEVSKSGMVYLINGDSYRAERTAHHYLKPNMPVIVHKSPLFDVVQSFDVVYEDYVVHGEIIEHFYMWNGLYNYVLLVFSAVMFLRIRFVTGNFFALYFIVIFWGLILLWWF